MAMAAFLAVAGRAQGGSIFDDDWSPPPLVKTAPSPDTANSQPPQTEPSEKVAAPPANVNPPPVVSNPAATPPDNEITTVRPIPTSNEQQRVRKLFKDVYSRQLADQSMKGKQAIARLLIGDAAKVTDAPTDRFVMLSGARRAAIDAGDVESAIAAHDELCKSFAFDAQSARLDLLVRLSKTSRNASGCTAIATDALRQSGEAESRGEYDFAERFAVAALSAAKGSDKSELRAQAGVRESKTRAVASAYAELDKSLAILAKNPADPNANLLLGRFYCLMVGQWSKGLHFLAAGSDAKLSAAAKDDIKAEDPLSIAEEWRGLAEKEKPVERGNLRLRAAKWYHDALDTLTGLSKLKAEKELAALNEAIPAQPVYLPEVKELRVEGIVQQREWTLGKNVLNSANVPLSIGGTKYSHGLGFNPGDGATVRVAYSIQRRYARFSGAVGVNDTGGGFAAILTFKVVGDGKELWKSHPCHEAGKSQSFDLDVAGIDRLEIVVECPGTARGAHVAWVDPRLDPK
jgi:hypothetical protein